MKDMILIILTSHRKDCFSICLYNLEKYTDLDRFSRVYVLANAVDTEHKAIINSFERRHRNVESIHFGPRGLEHTVRTEGLVLALHRHALVVKLDEDVFVTAGWLEGMLRAYRNNAADNVALVSALVPNNQIGKICLAEALQRHFPQGFSATVRRDPVHQNADYATWIWHRVLRGDLRDTRCPILRSGISQRFDGALNINCILFDSRITERVLPFTKGDEQAINDALVQNGLFGLMTTEAVAHHYSFGPQQAQMDSMIGTQRVALAFGMDTRRTSPYRHPPVATAQPVGAA